MSIASYIGLRPRRDRKGVGADYDRYLDNGISGASEKQTESGRNKANTTGRDTVSGRTACVDSLCRGRGCNAGFGILPGHITGHGADRIVYFPVFDLCL